MFVEVEYFKLSILNRNTFLWNIVDKESDNSVTNYIGQIGYTFNKKCCKSY